MTKKTYEVQFKIFIDFRHTQVRLEKITGHLPIIVTRKWVVQIALAKVRISVHREAVKKRLADIINVACILKKLNLTAKSQQSQECYRRGG